VRPNQIQSLNDNEPLDLTVSYPDGSEVVIELAFDTDPEKVIVERLGGVHGCVRINGEIVARWPLTNPEASDLEPLTTIAAAIRNALKSVQDGKMLAVHWITEKEQ